MTGNLDVRLNPTTFPAAVFCCVIRVPDRIYEVEIISKSKHVNPVSRTGGCFTTIVALWFLLSWYPGRIARRILSQFKPHYLLHRIMRQDCLRACSRTQPANALNPRISQLLEADVGGNLEKIGRKAEISSDFIILGFWENSFYSILNKYMA